jgi:hypothetical protein
MSNRDGRNKHNTQKFKLGKTCPKCRSGELMHCGNHSPGHSHHLYCNGCKYANF